MIMSNNKIKILKQVFAISTLTANIIIILKRVLTSCK